MALRHLDYEILEYIGQHGPVTVKDVEDTFRKKTRSAFDRICILDSECLLSKERVPLQGVSVSVAEYSINTEGLRNLEDYRLQNKREIKLIWLANFKIPIAVSLLTNIAIHGIGPLLPRILEWFANAL